MTVPSVWHRGHTPYMRPVSRSQTTLPSIGHFTRHPNPRALTGPSRRLENLPEGQAASMAAANRQAMQEFKPIRTSYVPSHLQLPGRLSRGTGRLPAHLKGNGGRGILQLCAACVHREAGPLRCPAWPFLLYHTISCWSCGGVQKHLVSTMSFESQTAVCCQVGRLALFQWSLVFSTDVSCPSESPCLSKLFWLGKQFNFLIAGAAFMSCIFCDFYSSSTVKCADGILLLVH